MARLKLSRERYEEIKEIIVEMFEKYHVSCVPISGFEIATRMGIKIVPYSTLDKRVRNLIQKKGEDGVTGLSYGEYVIYYNDSIPTYGRINNTIMHEIGHIVLGHIEESELAEAEASFFAKYALAPPPLIHKLKLSSADEIAKIFGISYEAACYAYEYYKKWLSYGDKEYTAYEKRTLALFEEGGDVIACH